MLAKLIVPLASLVLAAPAMAAEEKVTYTKHVAPILFKQCAGCHHPGEVAPFSLLTFKDAAKRAEQLAEVTKEKVMPPWKAEPGHGEFRDARILTAAEKAVFADWAKAGAPEGDARDLPPVPTFNGEWPLGKPDLVIKMKEAIKVPADGRDMLRIIALPLNLTEDKVIAAVDFRPGNRLIVHHAIVIMDNIGLMADRASKAGAGGAPAKGGGGLRGGGGGLGLLQPRNGAAPVAMIGAWVPGSTPQFLPDGYGFRITKDAKLVLQMHYHPVGKEESDQSEVALYYFKKPNPKSVHPFAMIGLPLQIPPGEKHYKITSSVTLPVDITIHSIAPHMHQLGRVMKADATLPNGTKKPLVSIKDWDWNWQGKYTYKEPVKLPKGTKIDLEAVYDNSADNAANPNTPPKMVRWGEQTSDEMCLCFFQISTAKDTDMTALHLAMMNGMRQKLLQGGLGQFQQKK